MSLLRCHRIVRSLSGARIERSVASALAFLLVAAVPTRAQTSETPLSLRRLLDSALVSHPAIELSRAEMRAARGSRLTAGAFGNPVLSYQIENAALPNRAPPPMEREAMLMAMLPLETLYQRAPRMRAANALVRTAEAEMLVARQRVAMDAASAFYRTAIAQVSVAVTRDFIQWLDSLVTYNRARVEEGVAAEVDLLRSQLERDRASAEGSMREAELARARAMLRSLLSATRRPAVGPVVVVDSVPLSLSSSSDERPASIMSSAPSDTVLSLAIMGALARRPETRAARERVLAAGAGVAAERSLFVRQLSAMFGTKRSAGTTSMLLGLSMPLPLFNQNRGEMARASAEHDGAAFELAAQERVVRAGVEAAYESARILSVNVNTLAGRDTTARGQPAGAPSALLVRAEESRRIALAAYREGAIPLLQVLDAAQAAGDARLSFFQALYAQHESVLALLAAEGRDIVTALGRAVTGDGADQGRGTLPNR